MMAVDTRPPEDLLPPAVLQARRDLRAALDRVHPALDRIQPAIDTITEILAAPDKNDPDD